MTIFKTNVGNAIEEAIESVIAQAIAWEAASANNTEDGSVEKYSAELDKAKDHLRALIEHAAAHPESEMALLTQRIHASNNAMVEAAGGNLSTVAETIRINALTVDPNRVQHREISARSQASIDMRD